MNRWESQLYKYNYISLQMVGIL